MAHVNLGIIPLVILVVFILGCNFLDKKKEKEGRVSYSILEAIICLVGVLFVIASIYFVLSIILNTTTPLTEEYGMFRIYRYDIILLLSLPIIIYGFMLVLGKKIKEVESD